MSGRSAMRPPRRRGFTLVEVMVTLAVTGILLSMVGSILVACIGTQQRCEATLLRERIGSSILDLISRDLEAVYAYDIQGVFKGTDSGNGDSFEFVTTREPSERDLPQAEQEAQAAMQRAGMFSDASGPDAALFRDPPQLSRVAYVARPSRANPGLMTLFRTEQRFIPPPPSATPGLQGTTTPAPMSSPSDQPARSMEVYDKIRSFKARYLFEDKVQQQREWRDRWDDPDLIPAAVEIAFEIVPDPRELQGDGFSRPLKVYRTVVAIPVSNPRPQQPGQPQTQPARPR